MNPFDGGPLDYLGGAAANTKTRERVGHSPFQEPNGAPHSHLPADHPAIVLQGARSWRVVLRARWGGLACPCTLSC